MTAPYFYEQTLKSKQTASVQVFGLPVASTTQDYPIGSKLFDETTGITYQYVKFSGAIAANEVMSAIGATGYTVGQAAATAAGVRSRMGVSVYAANTTEYGFIAVSGPCFVKYSGTGYVLGDPVAPDVAAAGKVIEHTVANPPTQAEVVRAGAIMGFALEAEDATTAGLLKIKLASL